MKARQHRKQRNGVSSQARGAGLGFRDSVFRPGAGLAMGKRRERRLLQQQLQQQQLQQAGRRVKLDLSSAPPSGDPLPPPPPPPSPPTVASRTESEPISENPLSLLGQYSDDEEDDETPKSSGQQENSEDALLNEILQQGNIEIEQDGGIQRFDTSVKDEAAQNEWQTVLHEDSGEYYYWNLRTGETTWEMPTSLEKAAIDRPDDLINQKIATEALAGETLPVDTLNKDKSECDKQLGDTLLSPIKDSETTSNEGRLLSDSNLKVASESVPDSQVALQEATFVTPEENLKTAETSEDSQLPQSEVGTGNTTGYRAHSGSSERATLATENDDRDDGVLLDIQSDPLAGEGESKRDGFTAVDLSIVPDPVASTETHQQIARSMLEEKGEALQLRLRNLAGDSLQRLSWHAVMAIQTEVQLGVWKAFSALHFAPEACFALICDELTKIEDILSSENAINIGTSDLSHSTVAEANEHKCADRSLSQYAESCNKTSDIQASANGILATREDVEEGEIHGKVHASYPNLGEGRSHSGTNGTDVDMEVDMEVDNDVEAEPAVPGTGLDIVSSTATYSYPVHVDVGSLHSADHQFYSDSSHWVPPLPPDDGWAPPPPGETEIIPPPPPEEPPPLPPSSPQPVQTYISDSSVPNAEYYPTDYMNPADYVSTLDYQTLAVDPSIYGTYVHEVPSSYTLNAQANEMGVIEQPYSVVSGPISTYVGWATTLAPPRPSVAFPSISQSTFRTSDTSAYQSMSTISALPESSVAGAESNVVATSTDAKKPPKGKATKKRAQSVSGATMLNKKVSTLVSKWKQAKEELHGSDAEEDDKEFYDLEVIEKKKQKEIEEWRRQQIASGGALDNANFQPLGTVDWRERVKRAKKAEATKGVVQESSALSGKEIHKESNGKAHKPDLTQISKGLPDGWQAFWDEESGEVYYGNLETQETSWDKPSA